jgi:hypothetical protein
MCRRAIVLRRESLFLPISECAPRRSLDRVKHGSMATSGRYSVLNQNLAF